MFDGYDDNQMTRGDVYKASVQTIEGVTDEIFVPWCVEYRGPKEGEIVWFVNAGESGYNLIMYPTIFEIFQGRRVLNK